MIIQPKEILDFFREFAKNPVGYVILSGTNGTGKTYISEKVYQVVSPVRSPAVDYESAMLFTQAELNLLWAKHISEWGNAYSLMNQLIDTKLLILDDLGTRTPTESFMDVLYAVSDKRFKDRDKKGTIITTNLNSSQLREKFGDAFTSRVASSICFRFEGPDRRFEQDQKKWIK